MEVVIHKPTDAAQMALINKELISFYGRAAVAYVNSMQFNTKQIDTLYDMLETERLLVS